MPGAPVTLRPAAAGPERWGRPAGPESPFGHEMCFPIGHKEQPMPAVLEKERRVRTRSAAYRATVVGPGAKTDARLTARAALESVRDWFAPRGPKAVVAAARELCRGNDEAAVRYLAHGTETADGAFVAGFLALKQERYRAAEAWLTTALEAVGRLGNCFQKENFTFSVGLPLNDHLEAEIQPSERSALIGLAVCYRRMGRRLQAVQTLERLQEDDKYDSVVNVFLRDMLLDTSPTGRR